MPIEFVSGDLFDNAYDAQAFAHGCNCQGSMGAGVAKTFKARYAEMFEEYRKRCKAEPRQFNLGDCWLWKADRQPWVFNLGTQEGYWRSRASYEAIETALRSIKKQSDAEDVARIAMPRIGVGYGGLSWRKVRAIIEAEFGDWKGMLVVYEEYVAGDGAGTVGPSESGASRTSPTRTVSAPQGSRTTRPYSTRARAIESEPEGGAVEDTIRFYSVNAEYGCFSNFSPHPIRMKGKNWPTSEHYFQAQKFAGTPDEEEVRQAKSPMVAARMGRSRKRPLRKDWESVKDSLMYEAVLAKFSQHAELRETLLATGDSTIVEHTTNDAYWGDGGDGSGKNRLGETLMRVRELLRQSEQG
jgi:N-glycosidase YbiA